MNFDFNILKNFNVENITKKYYSRLGFNGSIKEEESEENYSSYTSSQIKIEEEGSNLPNSKDINAKKSSFFTEPTTQKKQSFLMKKYMEGEIEALLKV